MLEGVGSICEKSLVFILIKSTKLYTITKNRDPNSLQINFSIQIRWRYQIHRRVEVKNWKEWEEYSWQEWCGVDLELMQLSFSVLVWAFLVVVMATISWHDIGGCVIQRANIIQWAYNGAQLEVKSSSILGLVSSNLVLFFSLCSFLLKLRLE